MLTYNDILSSFRRLEAAGQLKGFRLDENEENVLDRDTGEHICSLDTYVKVMQQKQHCDFEIVYDEHATLNVIYRCNECGTVIFAKDDEDYDPKLACPTCGGYETWFEYWTKEDIENDPRKAETIKMYENMQRYQIEAAARRHKRGLNDWELWKKEHIHISKNTMLTLSLEKMGTWEQKLKGLNFHICVWKKENEGDLGYVGKKFIRIPLSAYAIYICWILPHTKKYKQTFAGLRGAADGN